MTYEALSPKTALAIKGIAKGMAGSEQSYSTVPPRI